MTTPTWLTPRCIHFPNSRLTDPAAVLTWPFGCLKANETHRRILDWTCIPLPQTTNSLPEVISDSPHFSVHASDLGQSPRLISQLTSASGLIVIPRAQPLLTVSTATTLRAALPSPLASYRTIALNCAYCLPFPSSSLFSSHQAYHSSALDLTITCHFTPHGSQFVAICQQALEISPPCYHPVSPPTAVIKPSCTAS